MPTAISIFSHAIQGFIAQTNHVLNPINVPNGASVHVIIGINGGGDNTLTVTDNAGNVYTKHLRLQNTSTPSITVWSAENVTGYAGLVISYTLGSSSVSIAETVVVTTQNYPVSYANGITVENNGGAPFTSLPQSGTGTITVTTNDLILFAICTRDANAISTSTYTNTSDDTTLLDGLTQNTGGGIPSINLSVFYVIGTGALQNLDWAVNDNVASPSLGVSVAALDIQTATLIKLLLLPSSIVT